MSVLPRLFGSGETRRRATDGAGDHRLARLLERLPLCRVIWGDDGSPYLLRIYLLDAWRSRLPAVFLHYFFRGDGDRELHNHPWSEAWSLILWGGYIETRRTPWGETQRVFLPCQVNRLTANDFHRVDLLRGGCWTLFVAQARAQEWGFSARPGHFEPVSARERRMRARVEGAPV